MTVVVLAEGDHVRDPGDHGELTVLRAHELAIESNGADMVAGEPERLREERVLGASLGRVAAGVGTPESAFDGGA